MRRRLTILLFVFVLLSLVVTACQPAAPEEPAATEAAKETEAQAPAQEETKVLHVWMEFGDNPAAIQALFDKYTETHPNVKVELTSPVETDKIVAALSGSTPPDLLITAGGNLLQSWYSEGLLMPLNDVAKEKGIDVEDFFPSTIEQCMAGDTYVCLPYSTDVYALFWNKDLFEDAGLDPEKPPTTMQELAEYAKKLTVVGDDGKLSQIGFIPDFSWSHIDLYDAMYGGSFYSDDLTKVTIDDDAMVNAMLWEQPFYTDYNVDDVLSFMSALGGYDSPDQGFYAGKVAMMVDGEWQVGPNFIQKFKPELNYGVVAFPPPADMPDNANTVVVQGSVASVPKDVADPDAAADLLAWTLAPENMTAALKLLYNLPVTKTAASDPFFQEDPNFKVFVDLLFSPNAKGWQSTAISTELEDQLGLIEEQVLHTNAEPAPLLSEAAKELQAKLDEVLGK